MPPGGAHFVTATNNSPFSIFTSYVSISQTAGILVASPVRMSNLAP
jgi:Sec-independent protein secretion pathway component TatC